MHVGIVCSSKSTLGHASVARALAHRALKQLPDISKVSVVTDQYKILKPVEFFSRDVDLIELGRSELPKFDRMYIDTMPFHNDDVFDALYSTLPKKMPYTEICHVGWAQNLPNISSQNVDRLKYNFERLGMPKVLILHSQEICGGLCDICNLSSRIGYDYYHTGLLLPEKTLEWSGEYNKFCCLSGGGTQSVQIVELVKSNLDEFKNLSCDFFAGPYSEVVDGEHEGINIIRNATDVFNRLHKYKFSISRSGYSTCCEHIAAGVPTRFVPIDHSEQRTNAVWAGRYVRRLSTNTNGELTVQPPELPLPTSFSWQAVL